MIGGVPEWNEETLRKAASWKAFKEGRALFESGAVSEAKSGQSGFQGTVRGGKRPFRVAVMVKSATDLDARCSCPENQSSGMICGHAVAVGLASLAKPAGPPASRAAEAPCAAPQDASAWRIVLPPNWSDALKRGKLAATLRVSPEQPVSPADERLNALLATWQVAPKDPLTLHLDGPRAAACLDALIDHPRLAVGRDETPVSIRSGLRLPLATVNPADGAVRLVPDSAVGGWLEIAGNFWLAGADALHRLGEGGMPAEVAGGLGRLASGQAVEIPLDRFLAGIDLWQQWVKFPAGCWIDALHFVPAEAAIELSLDGTLLRLEARLGVRYGQSPPVIPCRGTVPGLPRINGTHCEVRNLQGEDRAVGTLTRAGFVASDSTGAAWILSGEGVVLDFLSTTLPRLRGQWIIRESERFEALQKQIAVVSPVIEFGAATSEGLSFGLKFQTSDGIELPAAEVRRLIRSGNRSGRISGNRVLIIDRDLPELIDPLFSELDLRQEGGRFFASQRSGEIVREIWKKISKSKNEKTEEGWKSEVFPKTFTGQLRGYQRQGAGWLVDRTRRFGGALLADDMGLGKTIQTIACIECLFAESADDSGVVLVLATTSLLGNWKAEFEKFSPEREVKILHGSGRDKLRDEVGGGQVLVTSYGTLARDLAWHLQRDYRAVVLDEASLLRNPDTDHAKAVAKLRTSHRIALTGTPIENGVRDLWSVFRFIQPGWLGSREDFKNRYEVPLADGSDPALMERLRLKVSPFLLRRTKEQVAPELPSKLVIDEYCDLGPDQQSVYRELVVEGRRQVEVVEDSGNKTAARMRMLTVLLRLRQACCDLALLGNDRLNRLLVSRRSAKLQRLLELLEEAVSGGHRVLVFSQFQRQLLEIEKCISEQGWSSLRLDGQTRNRQELVDRFQKPDGPPVFLISLKAGGYGLNLTAADIVIHFDPWWNPAAESQATDRAHRIGQTRPVTVYRLLTRGTVEEKVVRLQAKKRELAGAIDEEGGGDAGGWSLEELEAVLRE